jgi:SAM-dependent methyltransferase
MVMNCMGQPLMRDAATGVNSLWMLSRGISVVAVDISALGVRKLVENAARLGAEAELTADVCDLAASPACFDGRYGLVVAATVLCQLDAEARIAVLDALIECIEPGGVFYVSVFTQEDPSFSGRVTDVSDTSRLVVSHFRPNELLHDLGGLRVVRYFEDSEVDYSHGPVHRHGVARAVAIRD